MRKIAVAAIATGLTPTGLATTSASASADEPAPYCQGGPTTNRFGSPYFMYEISMGAVDRFDINGDPAITALGDPTEVIWNGKTRDLSMGNHLYLRYNGGTSGDDDSWGEHENTPTDGARINFTFAGGEQYTADVEATRNGCEPQVTWTEGSLPYEPEPEVARPVASAVASQVKPRVARVVVTGTHREGTVATKRGAYYRVIKFNPRTKKTVRRVFSGRVSDGDRDRARVRFPKATKPMQVRVISYSKVIAKTRVTVR